VVYQSLFPKKVSGYRHPWLREPTLEYYLYTHNFNLGFSFFFGRTCSSKLRFVNVRDTCHEVLSSSFSYHLSSAFCLSLHTFDLLGVTRLSQTLFQFLDDMPLCKNLCHMCYVSARLHQFWQKPMSLVLYPKVCQFCKNLCHLCYFPNYVNFAKTYVTCAISQTMSILQILMSLVLHPKAMSILQKPMSLL
jgi:hypothetical protein